MMRTTVDIDAPILRQLKQLQKRTGRSLGSLTTELLAKALAAEPAVGSRGEVGAEGGWSVAAMGAPTVDLLDKEAVRRALDGSEGQGG